MDLVGLKFQNFITKKYTTSSISTIFAICDMILTTFIFLQQNHLYKAKVFHINH